VGRVVPQQPRFVVPSLADSSMWLLLLLVRGIMAVLGVLMVFMGVLFLHAIWVN